MSIDSTRARNWCFTLNNYTAEEYAVIEAQKMRASYLVIGKEVGAEGTPHLQGYIEYPNAVRGSAQRKLLDGRLHWEVRRGTAAQAADYCKEDGDFQEFGTLSQQGKRTDLEEIGAAIITGSSIHEVAMTYPGSYIRYSKGITALKEAMIDWKPRDPDHPPKIVWRWGLAGVGKTRGAYEAHKTVYLKTTPKWWDGYEMQEAIIIDDFEPKDWDYRELLRFLDRWPYRGEIKGTKGGAEINSPFIYITCEHPPTYYWGDENKLEQIMRRIRQGNGTVEHIESAVTESKA